MTGALDKEIRLSFAPRIRGTLPEPLQPLIPQSKEKDVPEFKYGLERRFSYSRCDRSTLIAFTDTPYSKQGKEISILIRKKTPEEEIQPLMDSIQEEAKSHGVEDVLIPSTDAYMTSVCFVGSKSLSHVLSCIERCKERLLALGPQSAAARRQIITSVMEYWKDQPGVGVNIIDKLLNYTIVTPTSVAEWALVDHVDRGRILSEAYIYEMVGNTVGKVTNRVRQIVTARNQEGLPAAQVQMLDETLKREQDDMLNMFKVIEDALVSVAQGSNDEMMDNGYGDTEEEGLTRKWGERWLKAFRRKLAVEQTFFNEAMAAKPEIKEEEQNGVKAEVEGDAEDEIS